MTRDDWVGVEAVGDDFPKSAHRWDITVLAVVSACALGLSIRFDVFERLSAFAERHEAWQLDELLTLLILLSFGLTIYSVRRWRELGVEVAARREAEAAAIRASRAKSDFLARMSHEIRTPMNGVIGMTEIALETDLAPEQRDYLETVKTSAHSLLTVINDILDFSKLEACKVRLERISFDLRRCLGDTLKAVALRAHQKGLELTCVISPDVPEAVLGDPLRLRQVIVNLVGNALKFTHAGEIVVAVDVAAITEHAVELRFSVRDTGIGIPPDRIGTIFQSFEQADSSNSRQYGGTGLGLSISADLVRLMGGSIEVESTLGAGSVFRFNASFDLDEAGRESVPPEPRSELRSCPVLVVDDNATNRRMLEALLVRWGLDPTTVENGAAALDLMRKATEEGRPFQIVLLDSIMPGMDGFAVAEAIKDVPELAHVTILMLTSDRQPGDLERCRLLGVADYLVKPILQADLWAAIAGALGVPDRDSEEGQTSVPGSAEGLEPPLRILVAEDNAVNQKVISRVLAKRGHCVINAENGREALEILNSDHVDLILMDIEMPEMDGIEAVAAIRSNEAAGSSYRRDGRPVPIVALTAHAIAGDRERFLAAGMDDYLSKPIDTARLFEVIRGVLEAQELRREPQRSAAQGDPPPTSLVVGQA